MNKEKDDFIFHLDSNKPRFDLLMPKALWEVARVAEYGTRKYGERNWETAGNRWAWGQLLGSTFRHTFKWMMKEDLDEESGLYHLAHAIWNLLALLELYLSKKGVDDRSTL